MDLTKNIILGVYMPDETPIHRLDPRTKIVSASLLIILLLIVKSYEAYLLFFIFLMATIVVAKIPAAYFLRGLKPMLPVLILMWFFQLFLYAGNKTGALFSWWIFTATTEGAHMGTLITLRVIFLFMVSTALTLTTTMADLTDGMDSLLKPLGKIGLPTHELVMTMIIALRFVLILAEELDKIIKAQMARGMIFDQGNFIQKTKKLFPVFMPLFINAFKRAEELIVAMESRSYRGSKGRTKMKTLQAGRIDLYAAAVVLLFSALVILFILHFPSPLT